MQEYPKFLYHKEQGAKLVNSSEEAHALGKGWEDSPAKHGVETHPQAEDFEIVYDLQGQESKKAVQSKKTSKEK